jgi:hypothetical protein
VPLPDPDPIISDAAVIGTVISEKRFPRVIARRITLMQEPREQAQFDKRAAETLDYSIDMTPQLEDGDFIVGCYAWSDVPDELIIVDARYARKGVLFRAFGGLDTLTYTASIMVKSQWGRRIEAKVSIYITEDAGEALADYRPGEGDDPNDNYLVNARCLVIAPPYTDADGNMLFPPSDYVPP